LDYGRLAQVSQAQAASKDIPDYSVLNVTNYNTGKRGGTTSMKLSTITNKVKGKKNVAFGAIFEDPLYDLLVVPVVSRDVNKYREVLTILKNRGIQVGDINTRVEKFKQWQNGDNPYQPKGKMVKTSVSPVNRPMPQNYNLGAAAPNKQSNPITYMNQAGQTFPTGNPGTAASMGNAAENQGPMGQAQQGAGPQIFQGQGQPMGQTQGSMGQGQQMGQTQGSMGQGQQMGQQAGNVMGSPQFGQ
jgi:hypothetical protein